VNAGGSAAVAHGVLYVAGGETLKAFDALTGAQLWTRTTGEGLVSSPSIANGTVYQATARGSVLAFDAEKGKPIWQFQGSAPIHSTPTVANGVIYFEAEDGLFALRAVDGKRLWSDPTAGGYASPAIANGMLYAESSNDSGDYLYAYVPP
jgi:eukaryotic-like serine/threonine-protein kinase